MINWLQIWEISHTLLRKLSSLDILATNSGFLRPSTFLINWLQFLEVSITTLKLDYLLEWLTELRTVLYLWLLFYYNGYKLETANEETSKTRTRRIPNPEFFFLLPVESEHFTLPANPCVNQQGSFTEIWGPKVLLGFHCVGMIDCIIDDVINSVNSYPPLPRGWMGSKSQISNYMVVLSGYQPPTGVISLGKTHTWSKEFMNNKDIDIVQKIPVTQNLPSNNQE